MKPSLVRFGGGDRSVDEDAFDSADTPDELVSDACDFFDWIEPIELSHDEDGADCAATSLAVAGRMPPEVRLRGVGTEVEPCASCRVAKSRMNWDNLTNSAFISDIALVSSLTFSAVVRRCTPISSNCFLELCCKAIYPSEMPCCDSTESSSCRETNLRSSFTVSIFWSISSSRTICNSSCFSLSAESQLVASKTLNFVFVADSNSLSFT